ncbi:AAA family ATPase [Campylobacter jejuni]|uniref:AAA family ATPase n=1 Tax=Campylobacter jejuni TaxID=197 RepID=UPI0008755D35|nr:AAA family ATPase [Campylobacter jejuni]EAL0405797.1 AAA family ATPase [Campylobacter jejuni]ECL6150479.1 AAA family ATPase [Campylobacter jejuni]ECO2744212.1 AAA domain-containing protein [Campylobacter jejuni]ECP7282815.1 AAA domain-containing protein [Campylobacter jejuni]ECP8174278.1 AAA domain-containing protein [Campylobacter jejuni]
MIVLSSDDKKRFKKYLVDFFHNAYNGNKLSSKDEVVNFNFFKKYDFYVDLSYGKGNVAKIPWIIFVRMDTQEYKASYGVYVYCGIKRENREIVVCIGESEDKTVNYLARNKVDEYNAQFNHQVYNYSNLSNDINLIVDKIILNMQWFKELPLNEIQDININTLESKSLEVENNVQQISSKMENKNMPLNQILYGSPGTGKTYHTIDKALEILGENLENRDEKKAKFDEYVKNGQIVFTTFHQSYGYEEFVEGIKPRIDSKENSKEVEYEIKDGIFKELCKKALDNYKVSLLTQEEFVKSEDLENKIEIFLDELVDQQKFIEKIQSGGFKLEEYNEKYRIITDDTNANLYLNLEIFKTLLENKDKIINGRSIKQILNNKHRRQIDSYYFQLVKLFKEREQDYKVDNNPSEKPELKPYIIIIDEINRGNVSKIFGELITLIEPSKRIGEKEELKVTLPYSGEKFGVPKNVYIIGTMNTADRSITSLDTALRRRFEFIEMMPDVSKLSMDCEGINLQELLKAINTRIEYLLDREKTIGHAFFVSVENLEDLKKVFQNKIIPLLQEYFYNDYALINEVLNDNGMIFEDKKDDKYLQKIKNLDSVNSERSIYNIASFDDKIWDKIEIYQAIYNDEIANKLKNENE